MKRTILNAGMILCGEQLTPLENGSLIIEDGIIREILPRKAREALSLEEVEEISLPHMTLMPGMIECHNHLCIDAALPEHLELLAWSNECQLTLLALKGLKEDLMSGVTTARCMGDKFYIDVTLKKLIEDKKVDGPRLLAAGIGMKGSHGAGHIGMPHCGAGEIRHTCRENLKKGADLLKLFITPGVPEPASTFVPSFLSLEEISAAVSEGARLGIPTAAHCIGGQGLKDCIDGGVDVIEHMYMAAEQDVERLAASRCVVDLTSGIFLDPSREEFLSPANALKVRLNRSRVRENVARIIKARLPLSWEQMLITLSVPGGGICRGAGSRSRNRHPGRHLPRGQGLPPGRQNRKAGKRYGSRYHCRGGKPAGGCIPTFTGRAGDEGRSGVQTALETARIYRMY